MDAEVATFNIPRWYSGFGAGKVAVQSQVAVLAGEARFCFRHIQYVQRMGLDEAHADICYLPQDVWAAQAVESNRQAVCLWVARGCNLRCCAKL